MDLFNRSYLSEYTDKRLRQVLAGFQNMSEDEVLSRSTDDLVTELIGRAHLEPIIIGNEPKNGDVKEGVIDIQDPFGWNGSRTVKQQVFNLSAVYEFSGDVDLFYYCPQTSIAFTTIQADIDVNRSCLTVHASLIAQDEMDSDAARKALKDEIDMIRKETGYVSTDVTEYNASLGAKIKPAIEQRKKRLQSRRNLAGALGFPLTKRQDAPRSVPIARKQLSVARMSATVKSRTPYTDEPALTNDQYEEVIGVIKSTILAMERTPSVVADKDEEGIRDFILVQLNGTFKGNATGETFVKTGKTDILVKVEDRHVFVGECKWWKGEKAFSSAIDQLLGYLPWRDEKAALLVFINQKDASAVIEKADKTIRAHSTFKRVGKTSTDPQFRRNFILGHPDDPEREITMAVLFAVFSRDEKVN